MKGFVRTTIVICALSVGGVARAEIDLKFGGYISSDIRYRLFGEPLTSKYPSQYVLPAFGFARNENRIRTSLSLKVGEKVKAVADVELVYYGYSDAKDIDALTLRERVDPYFIEANAAYIDIYKLLPGLDLRIGRQIVHWGSGDQFNPTSNLNTLDFSDPLLFGRALANNMVRADWNPKGDWLLTAVWVPIFRPAQLPRSAPFALQQVDRPAPVQNTQILSTLSTLAMFNPPTSIAVTSLQPETSLANSQVGVRLAGHVLDIDVSLSYYHGRFGIPVPAWTLNKADGTVEVGVVWPKEDVIGADIAGQISKLGGVGYWAEGALIVPHEIGYNIYNQNPKLGLVSPITFDLATDPTRPASLNLSYRGTIPVIVPSTPFFKLTLGADYSIGEHVYMNVQYLHGFIDEFGAGVTAHLLGAKDAVPRIEQRIGDYLVAGMDLKFLGGTVLFRLFGVLKLPSVNPAYNPNLGAGPGSAGVCDNPTMNGSKDYRCLRFDDYRATAVLYPMLSWQVWDATELSVGAFIFLGDRSTKFGDPETGATEVFAKAKFTY